jgi:hypothetical protein
MEHPGFWMKSTSIRNGTLASGTGNVEAKIDEVKDAFGTIVS